ncbi:MAG: hypothetical protein KJ655_02405 [Candidatus Thermoplasmatota archaeon]|nr:hypothetical protein [Candidatus Thermoplasmatota archaeon]
MLILVRYGEIGLKSRSVRRRFEKKLISNIEDAFLRNKIECSVTSEWGRIYVYTENLDKGVSILKNIFGVTSLSPVVETSSEIDDICKTSADYSKKIIKKGQSFAVRSRRTGSHPYSSMDVAVKVGNTILNSVKNVSVNLNAPDAEVFVEVRNNRAYVFSEKILGPGGMPLGTQGRVAALIDDEKSVVAAWLMMKRGGSVIPVYEEGNRNAAHYLKVLEGWNNLVKPFVIKSDNLSEQVQEIEKFSRKNDALAIVIGFDEFKNIESFLPLFFPLIGLDNDEIKKLWQKIIFEQ